MILPVIQYGDPVLRRRGEKIARVTPEIAQLIADMLETVHAVKGVGLAAHQVGQPLQLTVLDVRSETERPSTLQILGQTVSVADSMPLVLINPSIQPVGPPVAGPEGCLSFPEIFGDIVRFEVVEVTALDANGQPLQFRCGGLLARAVQHELDHLQGILFIDRMTIEDKEKERSELLALQAATQAALKARK